MPSIPPGVALLLLLVGVVAIVGLQAAAGAGNWRTFWVACKQFGAIVLALAAVGLVVGGFVRMLA